MPSVKQDAVQEIKDRLDLADLISEHLRLQKAGRDLKGLCPFHQEKTPSLYVSPEKQLWHCYGCQKGGDHFTFIQEIEHVDFRAALDTFERLGPRHLVAETRAAIVGAAAVRPESA